MSILDSNSVQENVFGTDNGLQSIIDETFGSPETLLGPLTNTTHGISGELHKTDDDTILELKNFHYDGKYVLGIPSIILKKKSRFIASFIFPFPNLVFPSPKDLTNHVFSSTKGSSPPINRTSGLPQPIGLPKFPTISLVPKYFI